MLLGVSGCKLHRKTKVTNSERTRISYFTALTSAAYVVLLKENHKQLTEPAPSTGNLAKPTCPGVPWRDLQFRGPLLGTGNTVLKQNCHLACAGVPWDRSAPMISCSETNAILLSPQRNRGLKQAGVTTEYSNRE